MALTEMEKGNENIALNPSEQGEFEKLVKDLDAADPNEKEASGTMYIGHLPRGFYDKEIRAYFTQFGVVNKVRLARSKKTGGYKGYGYVQFQSEEVAKIAAETMNNYLMFDKLLKCQFVPESKLHPNIWKGHNKRFVWFNKTAAAKRNLNKDKSKDELQKLSKKLLKKDEMRRKKLSELGIDYTFPGYAGAIKREKKKKKLIKKLKNGKKQQSAE